jgi:hypothetical protein
VIILTQVGPMRNLTISALVDRQNFLLKFAQSTNSSCRTLSYLPRMTGGPWVISVRFWKLFVRFVLFILDR